LSYLGRSNEGATMPASVREVNSNRREKVVRALPLPP